MDHERGREFRRKKYAPHKEKEEKPMKILLKPKEGEKSRKSEDIPTPVILLKNKDAKVAEEPRFGISHPAPKSFPDGPTRAPEMRESVKLIDFDTMTIQCNLVEYLKDTTDFLVVGCLGLQGVGKSTLLSHLAFPPDGEKNSNLIFKPQAKNHIDSGSHCTEGVDAFVTPDRIIFLDTMPIFSLSVLLRCQSGESGGKISRDDPQQTSSFIPNVYTNENDIEIMALQSAAFLFAVCHVIIIAQDFSFDADFVRFLQTAEMLKPSSGVRLEGDSLIEYFPHCIFVHNQAHQMMFDYRQFSRLQDSYRQIFKKSQLPVHSDAGIGKTLVALNANNCGEPMNLFLLPNYTAGEREIQAATYDHILDELRAQILCLRSSLINQVVLTEKKWFHCAAKMWEDVKRSQLFSEYYRLLPSPYASKSDS